MRIVHNVSIIFLLKLSIFKKESPMKNQIVPIFFLLTVSLLQSCSNDDPSPLALVVAERSTGKLFVLDKTNGSRTEVGEVIQTGGEKLTNIRGMIFDANNRKIFVTTATSGGGAIYSVDTETLIATVINNDPSDHWYGVSDVMMTSDNQILCALYYRSGAAVGFGPGLLLIDNTGTVKKQARFSINNICCGMGMVAGGSNNQIIIAGSNLEIFSSNIDGATKLIRNMVLVEFNSEDPGDYAIQNMVKDPSGTVYAIVYGYADGNTYLAEVDFNSDELINIGRINDVDPEVDLERYHGLMLIPRNQL